MTTSDLLMLAVFWLFDLLANKCCRQLFWDDLAPKIGAYVKHLLECDATDFELVWAYFLITLTS